MSFFSTTQTSETQLSKAIKDIRKIFFSMWEI